MPGLNKDLPVVTVVIPCHNHEKLVLRAVDSVVNNGYPRVIVAVVDDGSRDNSRQIILSQIENQQSVGENAIQGVYKGVPIVLLWNDISRGPSFARNMAIKALWNNCHLFAMLDADDYYLGGKLEKCATVWMSDPDNIGLVYHDILINNLAVGSFLYEYREPFDRKRLEQECIISHTPLVSKAAFQVVGLYDDDMRTCEDWDLWLRVTERFIAVHIPEALSVYSVTGYNATDTVPREIWQHNWQRVQQKLKERYAQARR